ncbi:MAG: 3-hydroxylacyl-ACP dehydratase [Betaproteobacteria bacterium]|nr:3-hydroxylacyl-ACP dehydratase [Betaproteobacteria bacterium]MDH5222456.1 3-hydroxylacyl-ACP dehydratase [Betaproteobacteria bacterium]MDH5350227.1 3-hydroxylacyl-ACP dehydratase [Betaproteobacteria bacterium]
MRLGKDWIEAHIPHHGAMCLLDGVLEYDARRIVCRASSHADPGNPLRVGGRLPAACGVEYGAQAMAVHGALLAADGAPLGPGILASVRALTLHADRLDDVPGPLRVTAERRSGEQDHILYDFSISGEAGELLHGRATVVLDARKRA